ncbi:SHOCT domain-containing protein [Chitinilyticum piscinae]|uniref:SHOCT domain-containing protein n=1 Tax=Chitinilyticum piscinae TaxID=2866724 RepID=A0A8J7FK13_9NEIS|nr:SHOCT domain-containing protein [Chitinilyticum piscinae]MBE9610840.1 SHOCT domain-containing protein [Chitinilyticum piscinae]
MQYLIAFFFICFAIYMAIKSIVNIMASLQDKIMPKKPVSTEERLYVADEIKKLSILLHEGLISKEEFNRQKSRLLQ